MWVLPIKGVDTTAPICHTGGLIINKGVNTMSISSNARASQIARNVKSGHYVKNAKFHNYGSVVEDSIFAQQREADARLALLKAQRKTRTA